MIVCPNCNHQNPEGSIQCESCYTPLPSTSPCPNCGAAVQIDATFCGQCGFNLQAEKAAIQDEVATNPFSLIDEDLDDLSLENTIPTAVGNIPIASPWDQEIEEITLGQAKSMDDNEAQSSSSSSESEMPWEADNDRLDTVPWEESDAESSAEIPELLEINSSELEIPELPDLNLEVPEESFDNLELPELNLELPDVANDELPELNLELPDVASDEISELNLELPDVANDEIPDLSLELPEEGENIDLDRISLETPEVMEGEIELTELNSDVSAASIETSELEGISLETPEVMEGEIELPELNSDASAASIETSELEESNFATSGTTNGIISELSQVETDVSEESVENAELPELNSETHEAKLDSEKLVAQSPSESLETSSATQLQIQEASLFHVQTSATLEITQNLDVIHIGKPNGQIPPDIDTSGFPNSDIVSRIHADIRVEGDAYFIEDVGSSNGTYINHIPLQRGNRYRLRTGDRIALGKGDLVTFIFQIK